MRVQKLMMVTLAALFCLAAARSGMAQVYNGGMGGTGVAGSPGTKVYTPPKGGYKSSTGIAIGAAAAAGVGLTYFMLRRRGRLEGCVASASGKQIITTKDGKAYALTANGLTLGTGDRVALKGKKSTDGSGAAQFTADKLVKDYGPCN